jgi:hypothetical protein
LLKKQLEENDRQMKLMQQSYEEKIAASQAVVFNLISLNNLISKYTNFYMDNLYLFRRLEI